MTNREHSTEYRKEGALANDDAKRRLAAVIAAGISKLRSFPSSRTDGGAVRVQFRQDGTIREIEIPPFGDAGPADGIVGSENHQRFRAVKRAIGQFDTEPFPRPQVESRLTATVTSIGWWVLLEEGEFNAMNLRRDGTSEIVVRRLRPAREPQSGWVVEESDKWVTYRKVNPLPAATVKAKLDTLLKDGVVDLTQYPADTTRPGNMIVLMVGKTVLRIAAPPFAPEREQYIDLTPQEAQWYADVEKTLSGFDTDAFERAED